MDYNSMTIPQLREYAAGEGIDLAGATRKQDIINAIEAVRAAQNLSTDTSKDGEGTNTPPSQANAPDSAPEHTKGKDENTPEDDPVDTPENVTETSTIHANGFAKQNCEIPKDDETESPPPDDKPPDEVFTLGRVLRVNRRLMTGADVKAVQAALISKGFHVGAGGAGGKYNANTALAVRHFQAANGLFVSGRVDKKTAAALGAKWTGK